MSLSRGLNAIEWASVSGIPRAVSDRTMNQRAANLGAKIRAEDGVAKAVEIIEEIERYRLTS